MRDRALVLLVEDDPGDATLVRRALCESRRTPYTVERVASLAEMKDALRVHRPAVLLCDLGLPDAEGLDIVHAAAHLAPDVPLVVLTGNADEALGLDAVHYGAQDYIVKGECTPRHLERALSYAIERKRLLARTDSMAMYDPVTGLASAALFVDRVHHAMSRGGRAYRPLVVACFGIDDGLSALAGPAGATFLGIVGERLRDGAEPAWTIARVGVDVFAVLLEDVRDVERAEAIVRSLLSRLHAPYRVFVSDPPRPVPIEPAAVAGLAVYPDDAAGAEALLEAADDARKAAPDLIDGSVLRYAGLKSALRRARTSPPPG